MIGHLLLDFDGTLVDSSAGILESMRRAVAATGRTVRVELTSAMIGPPLRVLAATAIGSSDPELLGAVEGAFKRDYDERGYLSTHPYTGVEHALGALGAGGVRLHIVTNKRLVPTRQILAALGWTDLFSSVNTLDSCAAAKTKTDVVRTLLVELGAPGANVALVGDSADDAAAAHGNGLAFGWASWGYGRDPVLASQGTHLADAADLLRHYRGTEDAGP